MNATLTAGRISPIAFAAVTLLAGCGVPATLPAAPVASNAAVVTPSYTTLATGTDRMKVLPVPTVEMRSILKGVSHSSSLKQGAFKVLRTASDAALALAQVAPGRSDAFAAIDFGRSEVLMVALGQQAGMVQVAITAVEDRGDRLHVQSVRSFPTVEFPTMDIGWPYHAVVVNRADKPVEFTPVVDLNPDNASGGAGVNGDGTRRLRVHPVGSAPVK